MDNRPKYWLELHLPCMYGLHAAKLQKASVYVLLMRCQQTLPPAAASGDSKGCSMYFPSTFDSTCNCIMCLQVRDRTINVALCAIRSAYTSLIVLLFSKQPSTITINPGNGQHHHFRTGCCTFQLQVCLRCPTDRLLSKLVERTKQDAESSFSRALGTAKALSYMLSDNFREARLMEPLNGSIAQKQGYAVQQPFIFSHIAMRLARFLA